MSIISKVVWNLSFWKNSRWKCKRICFIITKRAF